MRGETHGFDRTIAQLILMEADSMQAYRKIVILLIELGAVALVPPKLAYTYDHQRMDLNAWFQSLKSKSGASCCDGGEAEHAEAEWDMAKSGYKVLLKNRQSRMNRGNGSTSGRQHC
jgi:hypothetical protein